MSDSVRELLAQMVVPPALAAALASDAVPDKLEIGQVWRARWDDTTTLVLLTGVAESSVEAVAVTLAQQPPAGSEVPTVGIPSDALPEATAWPRTRTRLPLRVLDHFVDISETTTAAAEAVATDPSVVEVDVFDPGLELEAELADALQGLAAAPSLEVLDTSSTSLTEKLTGDALTSIELLQDLLGVPLHTAKALLQGKAALTGEQAQALAAAGKLEAGHDVAFPADIVLELDQPFHKAAIIDIATRRALPELEVRREAARKAYALAARITATPDAVRVRVQHALEALT